MLTYKKNNILLDEFINISEFYKYIKNTPRRKTAGNSSEQGDTYFTKTENLDEAYNLLINGDEKLFDRYKSLKKIEINKLLGNAINKPKNKDDIVGFQANVPQYLLGLPNNMINQIPKKISQKILNIALSFCVSSSVSTSNIEKTGNLYIQIIDLLEKTGYRTNLYLIFANDTSRNGKIYNLIRIKTDREPFNIKKCIFPLMHPSMLRRLNFKYWEVCDCFFDSNKIDFTQGGYGRVNDNEKEIKDILRKILKNDFIVWRFQNFDDNIEANAENILKELKEKYRINIMEE